MGKMSQIGIKFAETMFKEGIIEENTRFNRGFKFVAYKYVLYFKFYTQ